MFGSRIQSLARTVLRVQPGEYGRVALMFCYIFFTVGTFVAARITRDTLFLKQFNVNYLAYMYLASPLMVSLTAYIYSRFTDRIRRDLLIMEVTVILSAVFFGARLLKNSLPPIIFYPGLYIYVEVMGMLTTVQFWTFANDIFTSREAKRLFGVIGAGGVLAGTICGFTVKSSVKTIGVENLLFICSASLAFCTVIVFLLGKVARQQMVAYGGKPQPARKQRYALKGELARIFGSRYLKLIAALISVTFLTTTLVDFQFKMFIGRLDEIRLASFLGLFYGISGAIAFLFDLLGTNRLLERFGILPSLIMLPVGMFIGSAGNIYFPHLGLAMVTFAKGSENTLRYTLNDATVQLFYLPLPSHVRARVRAFIDGILKQWSIGLSGILLVALRGKIGIEQLSFVTSVLIIAWIGVVIALRRDYMKTLLDSLKGHKFDLKDSPITLSDESSAKAVKQALKSGEEDQIIGTIEILGEVEAHSFQQELLDLLGHPSTRVVETALGRLEGAKGPKVAAAARLKLIHKAPAVRAAAVQTLCGAIGEAAVPEAAPLLKDDTSQVRSAAITGLVKYCGLDGAMHAAPQLQGMLEATDRETRMNAAGAIADLGLKSFYKPLASLLSDPDVKVRLAAIDAASRLRSPNLLIALLARLKDKETAREAARAIAATGAGTEKTLGRVLSSSEDTVETRAGVAQVLSQIGTQEALDVLTENFAEPSDEVRVKAFHAASRLLNANQGLKINADRVREVMKGEVGKVLYWLSLRNMLREDAGRSMFAEAVETEANRLMQGIFSLLSILRPGQKLEAVYNNLHSSSAVVRANAVEFVDNILDKRLKAFVIPLIDERPVKYRLRALEELARPEVGGFEEELRKLITGPAPWLSIAAMHQAAAGEITGLKEAVLSAAASADPNVRQSSLWAVSKMYEEDESRQLAKRFTSDPSPLVSAYAMKLLGEVV